jgi:rhodanese-related sulfurtransferase
VNENRNLIRTYDEIIKNIETQNEQLVDVRPPPAFNYDRIHNSVNLPMSEFINLRSREFKTKEELTECNLKFKTFYTFL